ncbi:hypothetical protein FOCC_FOCC015733 [Frankliniella occidentalis]|nr:hypothetical protein FOCC_FOCC015733 [Frankliniella occidentalis]
MLKSVHPVLKKVQRELEIMGRGEILQNISATHILAVIKVVEPIEQLARQKNCSNTFNASHYQKIVDLCQDDPKDSPLAISIKTNIKNTVVHIVHILSVIKKCKEVVTFMKNSGLNDSLKGGCLIQEINGILEDRGEKEKLALKLDEEDIPLLLDLIQILEPFQKAIQKLEAANSITIHHVIPRYRKLKKLLRPQDADTAVMAMLRASLLAELEKKVPKNLHMACFSGQDLQAFLDTQRHSALRWILDHVCTLCKEQEEALLRRGKPHSRGVSEQSAPCAKRRRAHASSDDEYEDLLEPGQAQQTQRDEVEDNLKLADISVGSADILSWWKAHAPLFPTLSRVVRMILATPASSAASERIFSVAGLFVTSRRSGMSTETLDDLLFLNSFFKKFKISDLV